MIPSNVFKVGRTIISLNVSLRIASGVTCVERRKNSGWSGRITFTIRSSSISCGWGYSIGKGRMFVLMRQSLPCVSQRRWLQDYCLVSWSWKRRYLNSRSIKSSSNKFFYSVTLWSVPSMMRKRRSPTFSIGSTRTYPP